MSNTTCTASSEGYVTLPSGYKVKMVDSSYFGSTRLPTLHFHQLHWNEFLGVNHPEVGALTGSTPNNTFCWPPGAKVVISQDNECRIVMQVYAKEMPNSAVMTVLFPAPDDEDVAKGFGTWLYSAAFVDFKQRSPDRFALHEQVFLNNDAQTCTSRLFSKILTAHGTGPFEVVRVVGHMQNDNPHGVCGQVLTIKLPNGTTEQLGGGWCTAHR